MINLSAAEISNILEEWVNTVTVDVLAPCITRSSAVMALDVHDQ